MSLVGDYFKVLENFVKVTFDCVAIEFILSFTFSIVSNFLFEIGCVIFDLFFFFFLAFGFKSAHKLRRVQLLAWVALKVLNTNILQ